MNAPYLEAILDYIGQKSPMHFKKLKKNIAFEDEQYVSRAETFFKNFEEILKKEDKDLPYALDCYLRVCKDIMFEQIRFFESGVYSSTSFDEVNERVYNNPDVMGYYLHGLMLSHYLWIHQYKVLEFFFNNLDRFTKNVKNILEIGAGHGLFTNEIIHHLDGGFTYTVVDISETALEMSKAFVKSDVVKYYNQDIYQYETDKKFDFIIMGEVLEHLEDPLSLMKKLHSLGSDNVTAFITAPCNSPTIDHIYLFRNPGEIKTLFNEAGWEVVADISAASESKKSLAADDPMMSVIYGAFLKKK
jgi:protein-L-isoaspartate O-methyltransferase